MSENISVFRLSSHQHQPFLLHNTDDLQHWCDNENIFTHMWMHIHTHLRMSICILLSSLAHLALLLYYFDYC